MHVEIPSPRYSLCRCWRQHLHSYHLHVFSAFYHIWLVALACFRCGDYFRRYFHHRRCYRRCVLNDRRYCIVLYRYCWTFDLEHHSNDSQDLPMNLTFLWCRQIGVQRPIQCLETTRSQLFALTKWSAAQVADWLSQFGAVAVALAISLDLLQLLVVLFDFVYLVGRKQRDPVCVDVACKQKKRQRFFHLSFWWYESDDDIAITYRCPITVSSFFGSSEWSGSGVFLMADDW